MLFLGTEKYPKEDDYNEFLARHGGYSNAYTSGTQTVFHFAVNKEHLPGAMDRFAQFFLSPLFTDSATERELNAVDSEHSKNKQEDNWRMLQLMRNQVNPAHPLNLFATGNLETLLEYPQKHAMAEMKEAEAAALSDAEKKQKGMAFLRERLLGFHTDYYSANVMTLSVLGSESLDELEKMVVSLFDAVQNKNVSIPHGSELALDKTTKQIIPGVLPEQLKTEMMVVPVCDLRSVAFHFQIPADQWRHWESKPSKYLSHLLGHEGNGSVFSRLKEEGLATELCAGEGFDEAGVCMFSVDIQLTEKGESPESIRRVGDIMFSYIEMLRAEEQRAKREDGSYESALFRDVFREMQLIEEMGFKFRSLPQPDRAVMDLAVGLHHHTVPPEKVMSASAKMWTYEPAKVFATLTTLSLDNLQLVKVGKQYEKECSEAEKWYGTKHSPRQPISPECLASWAAPAKGEDLGLKLFEANPFIAEKLEVKPLEGDQREYPVKYMMCSSENNASQPMMHIYHKQDDVFKLPKMIAALTVYSPWTAASLRNSLLTEIWCQALSEELNEFAYEAELAGLGYKLRAENTGLGLEVFGYDDKAGELLSALMKKAVAMDAVAPHTFELVHQRLQRDLVNAATKRAPYMQAMSLQRRIKHQNNWLFLEKLKAFNELKREELDGVSRKLFAENPYHTEGLVMGNMKRSETKTLLTDHFARHVDALREASDGNSTCGPLERVPSQKTFFLKDGHHFATRQPGSNPEETNGAAVLTLQVGRTSVATWMLTSVYSQIISQKFFDELRTKQQLGYIVSAQATKNTNKVELLYLVQSETEPWVCMRKIEEFCEAMQNTYFAEGGADGLEKPAEGERLTRESFDEYRKAIIAQLEEKPKNLSEEFSRHWVEVKDRTHDFDRRQRSIQFLRDLQFETFVEFARAIGLRSCPSVRVEVVAASQLADPAMTQHALPSLEGQTINWVESPEELDAFMAGPGAADFGTWLESICEIDLKSCASKL